MQVTGQNTSVRFSEQRFSAKQKNHPSRFRKVGALLVGTLAASDGASALLMDSKPTQAQITKSAKANVDKLTLTDTPEMKFYVETLRSTRPILVTPDLIKLVEELEKRPLNPNAKEVREAIEALRKLMPKPGTPEMDTFKTQLNQDLQRLDEINQQIRKTPIQSDAMKKLMKEYSTIEDRIPKVMPDVDFEKLERRHAQLVSLETINKLLELYRAEKEGKVDVMIAGFTPPGERVPDAGFPPVLRIVKRYKDIYVNEHWHVNDANTSYLSGEKGEARLPDVIRIHYLKFPGKRQVPGSERLHVYDEIKLVWDEQGRPLLYRQHQFEFNREKKTSVRLPTHSQVSAPLSCLGCHNPNNRFKDRFKLVDQTNGDFLAKVNHETIVQNFDAPFEDHPGYREYLDGLKAMKVDEKLITRASSAMKEANKHFGVPHLLEVLEGLKKDLEKRPASQYSQVIPHLGGDSGFYKGYGQAPQTGVYQGKEGEYYEDAYISTERWSKLLGLDLWWAPSGVFPPREKK